MAAQRRSVRISAAAHSAPSQNSPTGSTATGTRKASQRSGATKTQAQPAKAKQSTSNSETAAAARTRAPKRKKQEEEEEEVPDTPSTPKRNRTSSAQDNGAAHPFPPITPRRKKKKNDDDGDGDETAPDLNRPVDPHHSTATLVTPHGSHITAYPSNVEQNASPSKTGLGLGLARPSATTGNILEHGIAHLLKVEPRLQDVIDKHPLPPFGPADLTEEVDPFRSLTSGIIGQQVSGAAASAIKNKFIALFKNNDDNNNNNTKDQNTNNNNNNEEYDYNDSANPHFPTPEDVVKYDIATLRTAGLSQRKAEYIQGLAQKFVAGELSARMLLRASDEEVLERLIAVRGLGQWSVEMFSCFGLKRFDVFSTGDLGVQRSMAAFAGRDVGKLKAKGGGKFKYMSEKDMLEIAAPFAPYRSLFMWYMWKWEAVDVGVMQN